jgi:hypothetical protein
MSRIPTTRSNSLLHVPINSFSKHSNPFATRLGEYLSEEGVVGDAGEEVPLAHVLGDDARYKLLQEQLQRLALRAKNIKIMKQRTESCDHRSQCSGI